MSATAEDPTAAAQQTLSFGVWGEGTAYPGHPLAIPGIMFPGDTGAGVSFTPLSSTSVPLSPEE